MVADFTSGVRLCTDCAMPLKSVATAGRVLALRPFTSPFCTCTAMPRAATESALRSCGVMVACVVHAAARARGVATPEHATKHKDSTNGPSLYLNNIVAAFPSGFSREHAQPKQRAAIHLVGCKLP